MPGVHSKISMWSHLPYTCYELGHTWTTSCWKSSAGIGVGALHESFRVYAPLYIATALWKRKGLEYWKKKLPLEILQSTVFLGSNAFWFITFFCIIRNTVGYFQLLTCSFLPAAFASFVSILIERKSRRGMLALYLTNLATETMANMLISRGLITPPKNGIIILFAITSACYMYSFKHKGTLEKMVQDALVFLVGHNESPVLQLPHPPEVQHSYHNVTRPSSNWRQKLQDSLNRTYRELVRNTRFIQVLRNVPRNIACTHPWGCIAYCALGTTRLFTVGFILQAALKLFGALQNVHRKPTILLHALLHKENVKFGSFLGLFVGLYRAVSCMLKHATNRNSEWHGFVAGFVAGTSMTCYQSSSITLYLVWKLIEIAYFKCVEKGYLWKLPYGDVLLYTISTAFCFHAAVFEPHNLRPAYWRFMRGLTKGKFNEMNRYLVDVYGTKSTLMYRYFWPKYNPRHLVNLPH